MKDYEKNPMMEMAEQGMRNCEQLFRSGLKYQEEASQYWNAWANPAFAAKTQKRCSLTAMVEDVAPIAQKRAEEIIGVIGKNTQTSAELLRKAVEAVNASANAEREIKWAEFWKSSLRAYRSNADDMMHINARTLDSCIDLIQKNIDSLEAKPEPAPRASSKS